jgi:hypothetical protein
MWQLEQGKEGHIKVEIVLCASRFLKQSITCCDLPQDKSDTDQELTCEAKHSIYFRCKLLQLNQQCTKELLHAFL